MNLLVFAQICVQRSKLVLPASTPHLVSQVLSILVGTLLPEALRIHEVLVAILNQGRVLVLLPFQLFFNPEVVGLLHGRVVGVEDLVLSRSRVVQPIEIPYLFYTLNAAVVYCCPARCVNGGILRWNQHLLGT